MPALKSEGNIRDYQTSEGYPNLGTYRCNVNAAKDKHYGANPDNDATFLRYPRSNFLLKMGSKERPVGIPQGN